MNQEVGYLQLILADSETVEDITRAEGVQETGKGRITG